MLSMPIALLFLPSPVLNAAERSPRPDRRAQRSGHRFFFICPGALCFLICPGGTCPLTTHPAPTARNAISIKLATICFIISLPALK